MTSRLTIPCQAPQSHSFSLVDCGSGFIERKKPPLNSRAYIEFHAHSRGWKKFVTTNRATSRPNLDPCFCE